MKNDKTEIADAQGEEIAMLGAAIATDKLAPVLEQNVKDISEITQATSVVIEKQDRAEENAIIRASETNNRVERTVTYKQFCWSLVFVFFVLVLTLTFGGKLVRGSFWFEAEKSVPQVERLPDENSLLESEIARLVRERNVMRRKLGVRNQAVLLYKGILLDRPELLEKSKVENKNRSEPLEFINWHLPDKAIESMFRNQSYECLEWVRRQPKWYSCLSLASYKLILESTAGPVAKTRETKDNNTH